MKRISEDKRTIQELRSPDASVWFRVTSSAVVCYGQPKQCDRIEAYEEPGQGAMVPWFAVYFGDSIRWRIPAHMVTVEYADEL